MFMFLSKNYTYFNLRNTYKSIIQFYILYIVNDRTNFFLSQDINAVNLPS